MLAPRLALRLAALLLFAAHNAVAQRAVGERDARAIRTDSVFRGYGIASLELGVANSPRTVFDVGSVSRQFTAMSILLRAKDGKLSIDDPVRNQAARCPIDPSCRSTQATHGGRACRSRLDHEPSRHRFSRGGIPDATSAPIQGLPAPSSTRPLRMTTS